MRLKYIALALLLALAAPNLPAAPGETFRPRKISRRAFELYEKGMYAPARDLFEKAADGKDDPVNEGYAVLCALQARSEDAEKAYGDYVGKYSKPALLSRIRFEHAQILFDEGRYDDAEKDYAFVRPSALDAASRAELAFKTGWCRYSRRDYEGARSFFIDVEKMPFSDYTAPSRYLLGSMCYSAKNFDEALKWFTLSAKDGRFDDLSRFYLVDCQFMKRNYDYVLTEGVAMFPDVPSVRRSRLARMISESYLVKGDAEKAKEYHLLDNGQDRTRSDHFFSGSVFYAVKDYQGAIDSFLQMTDRSDSLGQVANYQLGWSYIQTKNKVAALESFKAASEAGFNWKIREDAAFNYAKLAFDLNHDSAPFAAYLKEYSTLSKGDQVYGYMAVAALYDRDYAAAVEAYDNVETLDRDQKMNYAKANYLRASQLTSGGSWRDAVPYLKAAGYYLPRQDAFNQMSRYWLAESYYHGGAYTDALSVYKDLYNISALDGRPEGRAIPYNVAYCHYRLCSYSTAAKWFDHYLSTGDANFREDALVRRADCDFVRRKYKEAAVAYAKALEEFPQSGNLYPRYQQGLSLGLAGDARGKVNVLAPVLKASPDAPLYCETMYELGRAYMDVSDNKKAVRTFSLLRRNASDSTFAARALIGLGMTHRNVAEYDQALKDYKRAVRMLPGSEYAEDALLAIESIYQTRKEPEKYLEYVEANSLASGKSEADREMMYFNTAEQVFLAEKYQQAIASLQKYLDKYPKGEKAPEAWFYMAESYRLTSRKEEAVDAYSKALSSGKAGSFTEMARLGFASQSYALERWQDACTAYEDLLATAVFEENKTEARKGMMRSAFRGKDYYGAIEGADLVEADPASSAELKRESRYVKAKSLLSVSRRAEAFSLLSALAAEPSTPEGAEARLLLIQDAFDKGSFAEVENMVYDFAASAGDQSYWLARAFIVLGDSFLERGNPAQAKATWESVRDGYVAAPGGDDIHDIVKLKLDRLDNE